jgi:predicted hotdog family 3-hydroxylacyl-ACP dehydratase
VIDRAGIEANIPHSGTMCLLDRVERWDTDSILCIASSHRNPDNPLRADGRLGVANGVEYAAQAMAVHGSLTGAVDKRPKLGYLASVRALSLYRQFLDDLEDDLIIQAQRLAADGSRVAYNFSITCGNTKILEGRATVLLEMGKV